MTQINYMLKVKDAKLGALKKALVAADIEVVSLVEVFRQEPPLAAPDEAVGTPPQST